METYLEQYQSHFRIHAGVLEGCPAMATGAKVVLEDGKPDWGPVEIPDQAHPQVFVITINRALATRFSVEDFI